jgi:hypothetical protein
MPMNEIQLRQPAPRSNQFDYLNYLRSIRYRYAEEFNSDNPPPPSLEQSAKYHAEADALMVQNPHKHYWYIGMALSLFCGFLAVFTPVLKGYWVILFFITFLVSYGFTKDDAPSEKTEKRDREITWRRGLARELAETLPVETFHQDFYWSYQGQATQFRFIFHVDTPTHKKFDYSYPSNNKIQDRLKHDIELIFHQFTQSQTVIFDRNNFQPSLANWDTGPVECIYLPPFILTVHDFQIKVFRYRVLVNPPPRSEDQFNLRSHDIPIGLVLDEPGPLPTN